MINADMCKEVSNQCKRPDSTERAIAEMMATGHTSRWFDYYMFKDKDVAELRNHGFKVEETFCRIMGRGWTVSWE